MDLSKLRKEIPFQWKVQTVNKATNKAQCAAYIDARDVMGLLDEACGPENWQDEYAVVDGNLVAGIGVRTADGWVWKRDVGTESETEKEKGKFSDAFKRAAVKWGIGRFLYDLPMQWVDVKVEGNRSYPVDAAGKRIWDLTEHIRNREGKKAGNSMAAAPKAVEEPTYEAVEGEKQTRASPAASDAQINLIWKLAQQSNTTPEIMNRRSVLKFGRPIHELTVGEASLVINTMVKKEKI